MRKHFSETVIGLRVVNNKAFDLVDQTWSKWKKNQKYNVRVTEEIKFSKSKMITSKALLRDSQSSPEDISRIAAVSDISENKLERTVGGF